MKCRWTRRQLNAYLARQLEPAARERVASHVETCASCRERLRELQELNQLLQSWSAPPAPASLDRRVLAALDTPAAAPVAGWWSGWWAFPARLSLRRMGAMVLVGAAAVLVFAVSSLEFARPEAVVRATLPVVNEVPAGVHVPAAEEVFTGGADAEYDLDWVDRMILRSERDLMTKGLIAPPARREPRPDGARVVHLLDLSNQEITLVSHMDLGSY
jgi:anti-sigma factor RsiW